MGKDLSVRDSGLLSARFESLLSLCSLVLRPFAPALLPAFLATTASADFSSALTEEISPGKVLNLSLHTARLYRARPRMDFGLHVG